MTETRRAILGVVSRVEGLERGRGNGDLFGICPFGGGHGGGGFRGHFGVCEGFSLLILSFVRS